MGLSPAWIFLVVVLFSAIFSSLPEATYDHIMDSIFAFFNPITLVYVQGALQIREDRRLRTTALGLIGVPGMVVIGNVFTFFAGQEQMPLFMILAAPVGVAIFLLMRKGAQ